MPDAKTKTETFCATESTTSLSETTLWPLPSYSIKYSMESTTPLSATSPCNVGVGPERKLPHLLQIAAGGIGNLLPGGSVVILNLFKIL